jgi:unsaturated rhamnogalacturonyl hydrolase
VIQLSDRLFDQQNGLFDHGWNVNSSEYDPRFYWARANGWCTMAIAELLSVLPPNSKGRDQVLHIYRKHIQTLARLQDGTGLWHNLLDRSETFLETSASAMFVYSIAKGINEGWISHVYGPIAVMGWNALATKVRPSGEVCDIVEGTTFAHDNAYYFYRGTSCNTTFYGSVMRAGAEVIRLINNPKLEITPPKPNAVNSAMHFRLKADKAPR